MVRLKNPNETHVIAGFGEVNAANVSEELYLRLIEHEPNLADLFEVEDDIGDELE